MLNDASFFTPDGNYPRTCGDGHYFSVPLYDPVRKMGGNPRRNTGFTASKGGGEEPCTLVRMPTSSVVNVVSACQQGDRHAQRALYDEFHRQVYRLVTRMVGRDDADDLSQQIFLQVFQKIGQFHGRSQFSTWLYRLATNECLQHLRSRAKKAEVTLAHQALDASSFKSPLLDNSELLQTALNCLEPDLRNIFLLREIEKLNYRELSETLQISEGTVASRLNRARMQLRQHLVDFGWEP